MEGLIRRVARIITIAAILFISVFALDVFEPGRSWHGIFVALFMHLLPSFLLIAMLVIAWRTDWLGGILFLVAGLSPFVLFSNPPWVNLMLGGPFVLSGLLFLAGHVARNRGKTDG